MHRGARGRGFCARRVVANEERVRGEVLGTERDLVPSLARHRDGADREVDVAVRRVVGLLLGGDRLELQVRVGSSSKIDARSRPVDLEAHELSVGVAGEAIGVLVDRDDELPPLRIER
jgi:hypothetical protein